MLFLKSSKAERKHVQIPVCLIIFIIYGNRNSDKGRTLSVITVLRSGIYNITEIYGTVP